MPRKKADGIASIIPNEEQVSIQDLTMQDFFAAFALQGLLAHYGDKTAIINDDGRTSLHYAAFDHASLMLEQREKQ